MLVAKIVVKGQAQFWQLRKVGPVLFDSRPNWLLLTQPINARPKEIKWIHPDDTKVIWIREFA